MPAPTIVIAQKDPGIARDLATNLHVHFARVVVAHNPAELRDSLLRHDARVAVLDLDLVDLNEVREMLGNDNDLVIVCTHHSPDEQTWMDALNAGAVEFCHPGDLHSILRAARAASAQHLPMAA